jgi:hypothetical protein
MKPHKGTKCGNMPTGEYIKTSNRFEPLSSLIDLTSGNSFNEKIKHTDLKEVKRRIKLLLDKSTSTKLLNAHALKLTFRTTVILAFIQLKCRLVQLLGRFHKGKTRKLLWLVTVLLKGL